MCLARFEVMPKKFNEGSDVRLIDVLRNQNVNDIALEKPDMQEEAQRI
ncbi:hypothetical protein [Selenomonas ruminantium]|uniref:Uncharacterized protein n=1 Tax=Selenomonas ruminantium TaxID=971 RepID=A0A1H3VS45_SELRU|nr:hypothetical protein [Selenomonas ruminantium]SDZ77511.1 hypothetical protein SAMN05660648_00522 [Selenomonas ruminantium]